MRLWVWMVFWPTMHDSEIEKLVRVNLLAPILLTKYVSRSMLLLGEGRIVNISSIIGFTGFSGLSVYGATKSALLGFTRSLARELGRVRITVNAIAPGYMGNRHGPEVWLAKNWK